MVAGQGPLAGVRVLELGGIGPGPFCCMVLADLGADVIRIAAPRATGVGTRQVSGAVLNRGRVEMALDLKEEEGLQAALSLMERADVLVEGFRPGVAERLGLGPDACLGRNPGLVYVRVTGWGQSGPLAHAHGHDINYLALSGTLDMLGRAGQPPTPPINLLGDFGGGGMLAVIGALAGLRAAADSGRGQVVDASILDGSALLTSMVHAMAAGGRWRAERGTNTFDTGAPYYDVYETADARWMAVAATSPTAFASLCSVLGMDAGETPSIPERSEWPLLRSRIAAAFRDRPQSEWVKRFEGTQSCVTPVLTVDEAVEHPHNIEHGTFVAVNGVVQAAPAPRFSESPAAPPEPLRTDRGAVAGALGRWGLDGSEVLRDG